MRKTVRTPLNKERRGQVYITPVLNKTCPLSKRELEILSYVARGFQNKEIAVLFNRSWQTIRSHLSNIYDVLCVPDRTSAVVVAIYKGWLVMSEPERKDEPD